MCRFLIFISLLASSFYTFSAPIKDKTVGPLISEPIGFGDFAQMFLGLLVVVAAIFAMAWAIRRMGNIQTSVSGALRILGGISLGQRERVIILQVGNKQLLLGVAPGQIKTLYVLEEPIEASGEVKAVNENFAQKLQSMLKGKQP